METESLDADQLVAEVLAECHALLHGQMDRISVTVVLPDGEKVLVNVDLPHLLRTASGSGRFLVRRDEVFALGESPRRATEADATRMRDVLMLVDAAALGPLYRAESCRRTGAATFVLTQPEGGGVTIRLRPDTLLPAAIGEVAITEYLRTPFTWMPCRLTHPRLGSCEVVFEKSGIEWRADFFDRPGTKPTADPRPRIQLPAQSVGSRSSTPVVIEARATKWLVLDDPGDWAERSRLYAPLHDLLEAQNQSIAGFPILTAIDDEPVLAIPFRARTAGHDPELPPNSRVLTFAPARELEVYPAVGDFAARARAGKAALRAAAASNDLGIDGAIRIQPWIHLHEGPPSPEKLANPVVRVTARLR